MAVVQYKTPGVYVEEIDAFPPSIVGVETAVPVFVGYTQTAEQNGRDVRLHPVRIGSMVEYARIFGHAFEPAFTLTESQTPRADISIGGKAYTLDSAAPLYLYNSLRLFYANGGGNCYVVSVGAYPGKDGEDSFKVKQPELEAGLAAVRDLVGPTMLVIPEAVLLDRPGYAALVSKMLTQCLEKQDRVAILDVWGLDKLAPDAGAALFADAIDKFRAGLGASPDAALKYGMAYTPFLKTSVVDPDELDVTNVKGFDEDGPHTLQWALLEEASRLYPDPTPQPGDAGAATDGAQQLSAKAKQIKADYLDKLAALKPKPGTDLPGAQRDAMVRTLNQGLTALLPVLNNIYATMAARLGVLPPSGAMAGIYTRNDTLRGVWNAPANVGLVNVIGLTLAISNAMQQDLNMPAGGMAVNAIRDFVGRGTLVWGARTLDGNSNDWRYIQVRRALIYIDQSVKLALNRFVFEPNVAQTWVNVTAMIGSFLRGVWSAGGLMGASPAEAFSVQCGLGSTMTAQDVLEGRMIVQIKLQMVHPAEFIVLTFEQQMQGGA